MNIYGALMWVATLKARLPVRTTCVYECEQSPSCKSPNVLCYSLNIMVIILLALFRNGILNMIDLTNNGYNNLFDLKEKWITRRSHDERN